MKLGHLALAGLLITLPACSSIVEGTSQEIAVNTNPAGANCELVREGQVIGRISPTPGALTIKKTKHDITLNCSKDGFEVATYLNKSEVAGATVGNILLGGGIGWAIDSASGADNKYTSPVNVTLIPKQQQAQTPAGTGSGSAAGQPSS
ncbi:hypothetical protein [Niveispirillum sp. BGYR6]|uniref:hypothetical protein n=1 Tax=Niveispirillum sp. BGYR6 TaxID=2971249 RepID=UPI0022B948B9|nr:hypothetical protein [Niveispirillum sp. BGYR6]MDG5495665.1 hypothetical protein [Niveispirillum sp. BGYR6]